MPGNTMKRMHTKKEIEEIAYNKLFPILKGVEAKAFTNLLPLALDGSGYYIDEDDMEDLADGVYKLYNEEEPEVGIFVFDGETNDYLAMLGKDIFKGSYAGSGDLRFNDSNFWDPAAEAIAEIEAGTVDNAKPIYCHPITINYNGNDFITRLSLLIFNNSPTAFTKSSFISYIKSMPNARFMCCGSYNDLGDNPFYMSTSFVFYNPNSNPPVLALVGSDTLNVSHTTGTSPIDFEAIVMNNDSAFLDGVNKIN